MYNCLYESLLENVFDNCSCIPNFASIKFPELPDDFHVCNGNELHCAVKMGNEMGNEDLGLNMAINTKANDELHTCRPTCEMQVRNLFSLNSIQNLVRKKSISIFFLSNHQEEKMISTSSSYPNWQTFSARGDFCLVMKKVVKVCKDPVRKLDLEARYEGELSCEQLIALHEGQRELCQKAIPIESIVNDFPKVVDFLHKYASKNIAVVKIFIRDPYYTLYKKDVQISITSFVGNTGGLVGLCMGLSFISLFEMVYHIFNYFAKCCGAK